MTAKAHSGGDENAEMVPRRGYGAGHLLRRNREQDQAACVSPADSCVTLSLSEKVGCNSPCIWGRRKKDSAWFKEMCMGVNLTKDGL